MYTCAYMYLPCLPLPVHVNTHIVASGFSGYIRDIFEYVPAGKQIILTHIPRNGYWFCPFAVP